MLTSSLMATQTSFLLLQARLKRMVNGEYLSADCRRIRQLFTNEDKGLWCHSVVHWNPPTNPVDLEQREGRVHRYRGHAVRRNIAASIQAMSENTTEDLWEQLFQEAVRRRPKSADEMVPFWVYPDGPYRIERLVPILPFSRDAAAFPRLRRSLAAYRLAFGQPRQEELVEFLGKDRTDSELLELGQILRIDLRPPRSSPG